MASLVLSVAGTAIGSMFGMPQLGYAIGSAIGSAISAGGDGQHETVHGPRLTDLKVQNSTYGIDVPTVFNTTRLAGNIIWSTEIVETAHYNTTSSGGGKGGGGGGNSVTQVSYTYAANLAIAICAGPITRIKKIWGNSKLIFDVDETPTPPSTMTFYLGTESQTPNSFIQSKNGSTYTSAFRGVAYVVFSDYQLETHGNAVPNFEFEVEASSGNLGAIVSSICQSAGLTVGQINVTALTDTVDGYRISTRGTGRQGLEPLSKVFFFDCVESAGVVKFVKRGNPTPAATITEDDLDARASGSAPGDLFQLSRTMELELPYEIAVLFPNTNDAHQQGTQYERRLTTKSRSQVKIEAPVSMPDSKAKEVVTKLLHDEWTSRNKYSFNVSRKYTYLEPTDPLLVIKGGISHALRIIKKDESKPGIISIEAASEDAALWSYTGSSVVDVPSPPVYYVSDPGNTAAPVIFDAPKTFAPEGNELLIAACGASMVDWGGCRVWLSLDGVTFSPIGIIRGASSMGVATSALPLVSDPDTTSTLSVNMTKSEKELDSVSVEAYDAAVSLCYIDGEMIAFKDAALTSANNYNLTTLHRGLFNSVPAAHLTAVDFVKIDSSVFRYPYPNERIGDTVHIRLTSFNKHLLSEQAYASVTNYTYTLQGTTAAPAAANITGLSATASANNIFLQWTNPGDMSQIRFIEVWRSNVNNVYDASSIPVTTISGSIGFYADYIGSAGVTRYYFLRTINLDNVPSAFTASVNATTGSVVPGANSIVSSMIAADQVLAAHIDVSSLAAINADMGAITAGSLTINSTGYIQGGASAYTTGTGFWLGYDSTTYKFRIGNPAGEHLKWDGTNLSISSPQFALSAGTASFSGALSAATGTFSGTLSAASGTFSGTLTAANVVTTNNIAANAVTNLQNSFTAAEVSASGSGTTIQSATITTTGAPVLIHFSCMKSSNPLQVELVRGSTQLTLLPYNSRYISGADSLVIDYVDTPGAGTYTYYLKTYYVVGTIYFANRFMSLIEIKK